MRASPRPFIWIVPLVLVLGLLIVRPQGMPSWLPVSITVLAGLAGAWFVVDGVWGWASRRLHAAAAAGAIMAGAGFMVMGLQYVRSDSGWALATLAGALVLAGLA